MAKLFREKSFVVVHSTVNLWPYRLATQVYIPACYCKGFPTNNHFPHWRRKLLKVREATLLNWSDFLLQKLHSYGEALNLRGTMVPYFHRLWFSSLTKVFPSNVFAVYGIKLNSSFTIFWWCIYIRTIVYNHFYSHFQH